MSLNLCSFHCHLFLCASHLSASGCKDTKNTKFSAFGLPNSNGYEWPNIVSTSLKLNIGPKHIRTELAFTKIYFNNFHNFQYKRLPKIASTWPIISFKLALKWPNVFRATPNTTPKKVHPISLNFYRHFFLERRIFGRQAPPGKRIDAIESIDKSE